MDCARAIAELASNGSSRRQWQREPYFFSYGSHVLLSLAYLATVFTTLITNGLLLVTIPFNPRLLSAMNCLLINVCIAHVVSSLSLLPFLFVTDVSVITSTHHEVLCSFAEGLGLFFIACGVALLNLSAISFNRFLAIKYPTKQTWRLSKKAALGFNLFAWIFSASSMTPSMMSYKFYPEVGLCLRHWGKVNGLVYRMYLLLVANILPVSFTLLSFVALKLTVLHIHACHDTNVLYLRKTRIDKAQRTVRSLLLSFAICWTPLSIYWMTYSLSSYFSTCEGEIRAMKWIRIVVLFASFHGAVDPFLYTFSSSELRRETYLRACSICSFLTCSRHSQNRVHPLDSEQGMSISRRGTYHQSIFPIASTALEFNRDQTNEK